MHIQWNLYNEDTTGTTVSSPVYGGVLIWEDSNKGLQMGQSNGVLYKEVFAFRRCPLIEVYCTCMHVTVIL